MVPIDMSTSISEGEARDTIPNTTKECLQPNVTSVYALEHTINVHFVDHTVSSPLTALGFPSTVFPDL